MLSPIERNKIENAFGYYPDDVSPLSTAVLCDDASGVDAALAAGADPNLREPGGLTPVLFAAGVSRDAILRKLLAAGGDPNGYESDTRSLALFFALSAGLHFKDWRAYYTLLDSGADINFGVPAGNTIAFWAAALNQFDKVAELLDRGYRHDLDGLAKMLEDRHVSERAQAARERALKRARALIAARDRPTAHPG